MMEASEIKQKVRNALELFYQKDVFLLQEALCERCLAHRFAVCLEKQGFQGYCIDCEYNKSHLNKNTSPKKVSNLNGNYIDIIITKRNGNYRDDLVCFEIKRKTNYKGRAKDRENLKILTGGKKFGYPFGFYIIFGVDKTKTKLELYQHGEKTEEYSLEVSNEA
ncbi:hypothetical protein ES705_31871 [subsurface metagenome]